MHEYTEEEIAHFERLRAKTAALIAELRTSAYRYSFDLNMEVADQVSFGFQLLMAGKYEHLKDCPEVDPEDKRKISYWQKGDRRMRNRKLDLKDTIYKIHVDKKLAVGIIVTPHLEKSKKSLKREIWTSIRDFGEEQLQALDNGINEESKC